MHRGDDAVRRVLKQHGDAVGREDRHRETRFVRHEAVALLPRLEPRALRVRARDDRDDAAVDLPGIDDLGQIHPGGLAEAAPVFAHIFLRIPPPDGEIEGSQMPRAHPAEPRGKRMGRGEGIGGTEDDAISFNPVKMRHIHSVLRSKSKLGMRNEE